MTRIAREQLQDRIFPEGIPRLWCPTLTYFRSQAEPDAERLRQHLDRLSPYVKGILVPGSTGEGWEMSDRDIRRLLDLVLEAAAAAKMQVLVGILKTQTAEVLAAIESLSEVFGHPAVAGITVCPAQGAELSQEVLASGLRQVLDEGWPTALYQLPQVTQNELAPATVAELAAKYPNFILFKDTSGEDRVAKSDVDLGGVFLLRGSERRGYAPWYRAAGGPYDGFLLSTANAFAPELNRMIELLDEGQSGYAFEISKLIERLVTAAFDVVRDFPVGNPFTNANKILDHILTYGKRAQQEPPPMLYSGVRLPSEFIGKLEERCPELLAGRRQSV